MCDNLNKKIIPQLKMKYGLDDKLVPFIKTEKDWDSNILYLCRTACEGSSAIQLESSDQFMRDLLRKLSFWQYERYDYPNELDLKQENLSLPLSNEGVWDYIQLCDHVQNVIAKNDLMVKAEQKETPQGKILSASASLTKSAIVNLSITKDFSQHKSKEASPDSLKPAYDKDSKPQCVIL
jgi:hypothetical protein